MLAKKMKARKTFGITLGVLAVVTTVWLTVPPIGQLSQDDISAIRLTTIKSILAYRQEGRTLVSMIGPGTNLPFNVCFIGVTPLEKDISVSKPSDPNAEFISKLRRLSVPVLPVSQMVEQRLTPAYVDSAWSKYHDNQERRGIMLTAGKIRRIRHNIVVAQGALMWGDLAAIGFDMYILRTPFGWIPLLRRQTWLS